MVDINYIIGETEWKIALMDEADLKGELTDDELDELEKLKQDLKEMIEAGDQL